LLIPSPYSPFLSRIYFGIRPFNSSIIRYLSTNAYSINLINSPSRQLYSNPTNPISILSSPPPSWSTFLFASRTYFKIPPPGAPSLIFNFLTIRIVRSFPEIIAEHDFRILPSTSRSLISRHSVLAFPSFVNFQNRWSFG